MTTPKQDDSRIHYPHCTSERLRSMLVHADKERDKLKAELAKAQAAGAQMLEALKLLVSTIEGHGIESLSCDNDGEKYCECLQINSKKAQQALSQDCGQDLLRRLEVYKKTMDSMAEALRDMDEQIYKETTVKKIEEALSMYDDAISQQQNEGG